MLLLFDVAPWWCSVAK